MVLIISFIEVLIVGLVNESLTLFLVYVGIFKCLLISSMLGTEMPMKIHRDLGDLFNLILCRILRAFSYQYMGVLV